jgi:sarcosine oxidase
MPGRIIPMPSSSSRYYAIVLGVGAMGSAAIYHLARRGRKVLGLEQFNIPHEMGSSHGITRIIRLAYYEHPSYVSLLRRAYELWREVQQQAGEQLLFLTGSLDAGPAGSSVVQGSRQSCEDYDLPHEILSATEVSRRFPGYRLPAPMHAVFQPDGGFLTPERCIVAHVTLAQAHGAVIRAREPVLAWEPLRDGVCVRTGRGTYEADKLVISAGAWVSKLVAPLAGLAVPERQVLGWFQPLRPDLFIPERFPVFNLLVEEGRYYGLPVYGVPGFKVGRYHHFEENVDADRIFRECYPRDEEVLRVFTERYFPEGAGPTMGLRVCMFTNTPDEHFILDLHPEHPQVCIASPCSGHGFKFSSVVGEIMADLAERGETRHDISMHRLGRLLRGPMSMASQGRPTVSTGPVKPGPPAAT